MKTKTRDSGLHNYGHAGSASRPRRLPLAAQTRNVAKRSCFTTTWSLRAAMGQDEETSWQVTTAARLLEARKKNGRLGSRKSRGGCFTCKNRRVKCDESRPLCRRCVSVGRRCGGYQDSVCKVVEVKVDHGNPSTDITNAFGLESSSDRRTLDFFLSVTAPRLGGSLDKDFWCGYVLQLARAESFVLDGLMAISMLYEHPQYLAEFNEKPGEPSDEGRSGLTPRRNIYTPKPLDEYHARALRLYNRAICAFKTRVEEGRSSLMLALLSCLLFICIETIRDDLPAALGLFSKGSELLRQCATIKLSGQESSLVSTINLIFKRLGVLAAAFGHPSATDVQDHVTENSHDRVFANMSEARDALYAVMGDSHTFIRDTTIYKGLLSRAAEDARTVLTSDAGCDSATYPSPESMEKTPEKGSNTISIYQTSDGVAGYLSDDLMKNIYARDSSRPTDRNHGVGDAHGRPDCLTEKLTDAHSHSRQNPIVRVTDLFKNRSAVQGAAIASREYTLAARFEDLEQRQKRLEASLSEWHRNFCRAQALIPNVGLEVVSSLSMYYYVSLIWLTTRLATSQTVFDQYTSHFEQILGHAELYVNAKAVEKPNFTFEVGAVPPLYFMATKCRVPSVRRRALQLMARAPRKECMWGARSTAQVIARIIAIEEEGMGLTAPDWTGTSPDGSTVVDSVLPDEAKRVHDLEIIQNVHTALYEVRVTRFPFIEGRLCKNVQDYII